MMLPKDFLSIEDVADYLNTLGWSYDLSVSRDHYKLHKDIYDLIIQEKINLVFHYVGHMKQTTYTEEIDEITGNLKSSKSQIIYLSAYFKVYPSLAREMLLDSKVITTEGVFNIYSFIDGKKIPDSKDKLHLYDIVDDNKQNITASDLYIPKNEIDKLFNENNQTDHEQNIKNLESELAKANAELDALRKQADTPADDDKELSTRSQNLAAKIILALIDLAGLDKDSPPYQYDDLSSNNSLIHDQIEANGMNVGKQKIGDWLDLAIKQTKDK